MQRLQYIEILWTGSQFLTHKKSARGKYTSRRTQPLAYLAEAIRLQTIDVHLKGSSVIRRKHEPRAIIKFMKDKTAKQPNFRLFRSLRTLQGLDYLHCLRGLTRASFWDFDQWLEFKKQRAVRDFTFTRDVNNAVTRPKEDEDDLKARINSLASVIRSYVPTGDDKRALQARFCKRANRTPCSHSFVPGGPASIVIGDSSSSSDDDGDDEASDSDSDDSNDPEDGPPGPGFGPGGADGNESDHDDDDDGDGDGDDGDEGAAPLADPMAVDDLAGGFENSDNANNDGGPINLDFEGDIIIIDSDEDDASTVRGSPAVNPTRENEHRRPRGQNSTQHGEESLFISDDEMEDSPSPKCEGTPRPQPRPPNMGPPSVPGFFSWGMANGRENSFPMTPAPRQREESGMFVSPTPYNSLMSPRRAESRPAALSQTPAPFQREDSDLFVSPTPYNSLVTHSRPESRRTFTPGMSGSSHTGSPGWRNGHGNSRENSATQNVEYMDLTEDSADTSSQRDDVRQKRAYEGQDSTDEQEAKRARGSQSPEDETMDDN